MQPKFFLNKADSETFSVYVSVRTAPLAGQQQPVLYVSPSPSTNILYKNSQILKLSFLFDHHYMHSICSWLFSFIYVPLITSFPPPSSLLF